MENTLQKEYQLEGEVLNTTSLQQKRKKGNRIVEEGNILKVYPNVLHSAPFTFDLEDRELLEKYTIYRHKEGYAVAHNYKSGKKVWLHRVVMDMIDKPSLDYIDHINGDKSDNRKCNLRVCHLEDASNAKNRNRKFVGHEKVMKYRRPDDAFVLNISNGIIQDLEFSYEGFNYLLEDEDILWYEGVDKGLNTIIQRNEGIALEQIKVSQIGTPERTFAQMEYESYQELKVFIMAAYKNAKAFSMETEISKGLSFAGKKLFMIEERYMTSKEMHELKVQPLIVYYDNKHIQEPAGKHLKKPNGEMIYNS